MFNLFEGVIERVEREIVGYYRYYWPSIQICTIYLYGYEIEVAFFGDNIRDQSLAGSGSPVQKYSGSKAKRTLSEYFRILNDQNKKRKYHYNICTVKLGHNDHGYKL